MSPARGELGVDLDHVIAVHDEIDLPFGRIEARLGGGLAGHNGLKSLNRELGGPDFQRIRVGVGRPDTTDPEIVSAHVLGRFSEPEDDVRALVEAAADELERLIAARAPPATRSRTVVASRRLASAACASGIAAARPGRRRRAWSTPSRPISRLRPPAPAHRSRRRCRSAGCAPRPRRTRPRSARAR